MNADLATGPRKALFPLQVRWTKSRRPTITPVKLYCSDNQGRHSKGVGLVIYGLARILYFNFFSLKTVSLKQCY